jgi:hypothetical protein
LSGSGTNNWAIAISVAVGVLLFAISIVWLQSYFYLVRNDQIHRSVLSVPNPKLRDLRAREAEVLNSYGWVDQQQGIVRIPIDRAMERMVEETRAGDEGEE